MYDWITGVGASLAETFKVAIESGSPVSYLLALGAGVLAAFTPCVLPMVPVTVATIGGQAEGNRAKAFILSALFALGIGINCGVIGVVASSAGWALGDVATNPWIYLGIGAVCVLLAMSMFDRFHIPAPAFLQRFQSKQKVRKGYLGAMLSGFAFGFLAYACTAPIVGAIAVLVFRAGKMLYGGSLMFAFGLGIGVPFIVLGTFTGLISAVMQRGALTEKVKHGFGWAMLIIAGVFFFWAGMRYQTARINATDMPVVSGSPVDAYEGEFGSAWMTEVIYEGEEREYPEVGDAIPDFTWVNPATNEAQSVLELRRPLIITFFREDCHNCPQEVPELNELHEQYGDDVPVLAINAGDAPPIVLQWANEHEVGYPMLLDRRMRLTKKGFGLTGVPHNLVTDSEGTVQFSSKALAGLAEKVEELLASAAPEEAEQEPPQPPE